MAYGFRCIGDHGLIQIDDTYANLALIASGRAFTDYQEPNSRHTRIATISVTVADSSVWPVIGYNDADYKSAWFWVWDHQINGNTHTWRIAATSSEGWAGTNFTWYVFGRPTSPTGGYGLRVRDAQNRITFDSGYKYMKVIGSHATTIEDLKASRNYTGQGGGPISIGVAEKGVLVFGNCGWENQAIPIPPTNQWRWILQVATYRLTDDTTFDCYGGIFGIVLPSGPSPVPDSTLWRTRQQLSCFIVAAAPLA